MKTITANLCCPQCGRDSELDVQVRVWARFTAMGFKPGRADHCQRNQYDFDDDSPISCGCGEGGVVSDFKRDVTPPSPNAPLPTPSDPLGSTRPVYDEPA